MKYQGQFYQVGLVSVREMSTFRVGVNILSSHHFDINWDQRVDMR